MVVRQLLTGIGAGAVLALLALFLTIPRSSIEHALPHWVRDALPEGKPLEQSAQAATIESQPVSGKGVEEQHPEAAAEGEPRSLQASDERGVRVAGWGAGAAQESQPEPAVEGGLQPDQVPPLEPDLYLGALSKQTIIRARPDHDARILGFARTGALLSRARESSGKAGCSGGWYRVEPDGYICVGRAATLDMDHPLLRLASFQPDRTLPMPYIYGTSRFPTPPLYTRIPSLEQQQIAEQDLAKHRAKNFGSLWADAADTPAPALLAGGARIPRPYGYPQLEREFMTGRALASSAFAFIDLFEQDGRRWGLTADLSLLPLDRLTQVEESEFFGQVLDEEASLPVAFVRAYNQHYFERIEGGGLRPTRAIGYRQAFQLTGRSETAFGTKYFETVEGGFIADHPRLVMIEKRESMPKWAKEDRSWLEVSILNQTLVAYRGSKPVFATLVSTGKDGLGDPETSHSTATGIFLIHTKHVTSSMSGDEADDEFDLRDVPYVQYFHGGFAFHAAFWHDSFGQPRSHGCVNLSPADARHLFSLTEPAVPLRWHSALSRSGTLAYVHP